MIEIFDAALFLKYLVPPRFARFDTINLLVGKRPTHMRAWGSLNRKKRLLQQYKKKRNLNIKQSYFK
jgi:hypothetical protein